MRHAVLFALLLSVFVPSTAQATDSRLRTVVMGIAGRRGVDDAELQAVLSRVVLGVYAADVRRVVIGPDDIMRVLEWEASKQQAGCNNNDCLAEVGAALDAARIVNGTLDAVGDVYLLSLSEIDARTLEPMGRVQEEVSKDEAKLLEATRRLATELVNRSASALANGASTGPFAGNAGSIEVASDPNGAQIVVANAVVGVTPTRIDNVTPGRHVVRLTRQDYEPVEIEVPVHAGGTTKVAAELRIMRALAEQNIQVRNAKWREADENNRIFGWTKVGLGGLGTAAGAALAVGAPEGEGIVLGVVIAAVGVGVAGWGVADLFNPPQRPVPEWEIARSVTVTPPKNQGDVEVKVLQEAAGAGVSR